MPNPLKPTESTGLPPGPACDLYESISGDYELSPADLVLLSQACWCLVRIEQARVELAQHGLVVKDRYGCAKESPAAAAERAYVNQFRLCCRELGLVLQVPEPRMPDDRTYHR